MRRVMILALATAFAWSQPITASTDLERAGLRDPVQLGAATIRWLGAPIYDARLFIGGGGAFRWQGPMALQLEYRRSFKGEQLLEATMQELRRIEGGRTDHAALRRDLQGCYRDVRQGDAVTAVSTGRDDLALWMNDRRLCQVRASDIQQRFLGIWLSPQSRIARLGPQLRGQ